MDLRIPWDGLSLSWRVLYVAGCFAGPLLGWALGWELGTMIFTALGGGIAISCLYWLLQRRSRVVRRIPGWYPLPNEPGLLRWWDGEHWSNDRVVKSRDR